MDLFQCPRCLRAIALVPILGCGVAPPAMANPDVWVQIKYLLKFTETAMTGLEIEWTFDPFLSNHAISQFDADGDSKFSEDEVRELRAALFDPLASMGYFMQVFLGETAHPMRPESFDPTIDGDQLAFAFTLAPEDPIDYRKGAVAIGTYDAGIFFDFSLADENFLRVDGPFDPSCRFRIQAGEGPLTGFPQTVVLLCPE